MAQLLEHFWDGVLVCLAAGGVWGAASRCWMGLASAKAKGGQLLGDVTRTMVSAIGLLVFVWTTSLLGQMGVFKVVIVSRGLTGLADTDVHVFALTAVPAAALNVLALLHMLLLDTQRTQETLYAPLLSGLAALTGKPWQGERERVMRLPNRRWVSACSRRSLVFRTLAVVAVAIVWLWLLA